MSFCVLLFLIFRSDLAFDVKRRVGGWGLSQRGGRASCSTSPCEAHRLVVPRKSCALRWWGTKTLFARRTLTFQNSMHTLPRVLRRLALFTIDFSTCCLKNNCLVVINLLSERFHTKYLGRSHSIRLWCSTEERFQVWKKATRVWLYFDTHYTFSSFFIRSKDFIVVAVAPALR